MHNSGIPGFKKETVVPILSGLLLLASGILVFFVYRSYAWPAFLAILLYVGFEGVYVKMLTVFRGNRNLAAAICTLLVLILIFGPVSLLSRHLILQAIDLIIRVKDLLASAEILEMATKFPSLTALITSEPFYWVDFQTSYLVMIDKYSSYLDVEKVTSWVGSAYTVVLGSMTFTLDLAANLLLGLILLFFLFRDGRQLYVFLQRNLPFPAHIFHGFVTRMKEILIAVLRGNVFVSLMQGAALGVGLFLCGVPNALFYGFIAAIFSLIPVVGTAPVWLPAAIYLGLFEGSYAKAVILSIYGLATYLSLENILKPKLLDRKLGVHPLLLFLAILGGIKEFGITGVLLGPLFVTLFMTFWSIYHIWDSSEKTK